MIKVWQSYACNNSSSYRLVARFARSSAAERVASELRARFAAERDRPLTGLARDYGFDWRESDAAVADPGVVSEHQVVVVYHAYCLGLGPGVPAYLADRDGITEEESSTAIQVSALVRLSEVDHAEELQAVFAPILERPDAVMWKPPWAFYLAEGTAAWFRDADTAGMYFPSHPYDLPAFKRWLASFGVAAPVIRFEPPTDRALFDGLAKARCTACEGPLAYLDPRLHDIETPQLVCTPCGGLYDVAPFLAGA